MSRPALAGDTCNSPSRIGSGCSRPKRLHTPATECNHLRVAIRYPRSTHQPGRAPERIRRGLGGTQVPPSPPFADHLAVHLAAILRCLAAHGPNWTVPTTTTAGPVEPMRHIDAPGRLKAEEAVETGVIRHDVQGSDRSRGGSDSFPTEEAGLSVVSACFPGVQKARQKLGLRTRTVST